ncbi:hypothetical protein PGB90_002115 [Kerria lacca]
MFTFEKGGKYQMVREKYEFSAETKVGSGEKLFDYVAECVEDFCNKNNIKSHENVLLPMGFTFSFPMIQEGLNKGILVKWTKGFNATNVVGKDVVQLLIEAFNRRKLHKTLAPVAVLNDTTGTLMSCAWEEPDTRIGLIVGTGCNACYTERIENVKNTDAPIDQSKPFMIINCESGNFGADGVLDDILTEFDKTLDSASSHKREQIYEKLIAGRYLGEIMRLVIVKLINKKLLFNGEGSEKILKPWQFKTEFITSIQNDPEGTYENIKEIMSKIDIKTYKEQDLIDVRYISELIVTRSASLISAGVATLLNKIDISPVTVGVDGTVYRQIPQYKNIMQNKIRCLVKPHINFKLKLSEDGSGRGAAFVAAVLETQQKKTT